MKWIFYYQRKIKSTDMKKWGKDIEKWTSEDQTDYPPYCLFPPTQREEEATKHTDNSYICSIFPVIFSFFYPMFSPSNTFTQKNADLWHFYFTALKNYFCRMQVFFAASAQCWPKYKIIPTKRGSAVTITVGFVGLMVSI